MSIPKSDSQHTHQSITADNLHHIFTRFSPQDVEGFYQLYQLRQLQQKRTAIQQQLQELEELLSTKESFLLEVMPSTIAQAALSQFRASGINDIDLLERMLARGDHWLNHIWELFEHCQQLDMIQDNATEWCEHALEDTYKWLESVSCPNNISNTSLHSIVQHTKSPVEAHKLASTSENLVSLNAYSYNNLLSEPLYPSHQQPLDAEDLLPTTTYEDFLHKLMNDEESEIHTNSHSNITPILAACSDVACPVASASEAENSVLSAATPTEQSEPNMASATIDEQEATLSTSLQEILNLRPDNDQDALNNLLSESLHSPHQQPLDAEDLLPTTTHEDFLQELMSDEESEIHTNSHSNITPILAACNDVACPVASASEAENSVLSAATPTEQSEPNIASATTDEQEATLSTSLQETLNLRPNNDQDALSATEEQPQPEHLEETRPPSLEDHTHNSSSENLLLQPEHPEETVSTIPTYVFRRSPKQIKKKPQQYIPKPTREYLRQLLIKILGW